MTKFFKPASAAALLGAAAITVGGVSVAYAADLGGDCCADLEERVAELEATTARKGNRKVSLEVSGHVNQAIMYWDDGEESNTYVVTNDSSRTRFRFKGKAKITDELEAGYLLEIGIRAPRSDRVDQLTDDPAAATGDLDVRHSSWYLKHKTLGAVWVGETGEATEAITELNLSQTSEVANLSDVEDYFAGFRLRGADGNLSNVRYGQLFADSDGVQPGEGSRGNFVRYESPTFVGFTASASWGEDDEWAAALRYAGEFNGVKIVAGIGYTENTEEGSSSAAETNCAVNGPDPGTTECHQVGGSISVLHEASGVFVSFGAGYFEDDNVEDVTLGGDGDDTSEFYAAQAGIEQKWTPLGKTTLYGEYFNYDGGTQPDVSITLNGVTGRLLGSEIDMFGFGIVQGIDAAAMKLYLSYRHFETDVTIRQQAIGSLVAAPTFVDRDVDSEDLDVVMSGAIIKF